MRKLRAFTLIEILFVIALIALITGTSVMMIRKSADQARIDKAALEMQSVLQAAMAYDTSNMQWPESSMGTFPPPAVSACAPVPNPDTALTAFITNYLPNPPSSLPLPSAAVMSSLGSTYCWAPSQTTTNPQGQIIYNPSSPLFWVALQVPGSGASTPNPDMVNFANRLAAKLPNAITVEDPTASPVVNCTANSAKCYVRAEVPQPGTNSPSVASLVGNGTCQSSSASPQPGTKAICSYLGAATSVASPNICESADGKLFLQPCPLFRFDVSFTCPTGTIGEIYSSINYFGNSFCTGQTCPQGQGATQPISELSITNLQDNKGSLAPGCTQIGSAVDCYLQVLSVTQDPRSSSSSAPPPPNRYFSLAMATSVQSKSVDMSLTPATIGISYITYCVANNG